jgi:16S rRNA (uracil1498-N3)-methyltransferase
MPRILVNPQLVQGKTITLTDPQAVHHVRTVLRKGQGERVECMDGSGRWYAARIVRSTKALLELEILDQGKEEAPGIAAHLLPSLIKPERFDWLVQKATELGAARITPVMAARSLVRIPADRAAARVERWRRIAAEAAQQCDRATLPSIDAPVTFERAWASLESPDISLIPTLAGPTRPIQTVLAGRPALASAAVFIGPEGDFTEEEVALARASGAVPVSLGRLVLRTETAALAVLSILQFAREAP